MRDLAASTTELAPGIWKVSAAPDSGELSFNVYLLATDGDACLVDLGPERAGPALRKAVASIRPLAQIGRAVLLAAGLPSMAALEAWRLEDFSGEVHADAELARAFALEGEASVKAIGDAEEELFPGTSLAFRILRGGVGSGRIALLHEQSGLAFSGRMGASLGTEPPGRREEDGLAGCRRFIDLYGVERGFEGLAAADCLCPSFGALVPRGHVGELLALAAERANPSQTGKEADSCQDQSFHLATEVAELRKSNYELRLSMVTASDEALRDPASGLYGRLYADAFVKSALGKSDGISAAFVKIDRIKELNRKLGAGTVDRTMRDLAETLQELVPGGFIFRWSGPVILVVMDLERTAFFALMERARAAIEVEPRFVTPITVSVAIVGANDLAAGEPSAKFDALVALGRERLKHLERQGPNLVLDHSELSLEGRSLVLALDSNPLFLDYLTERLDREGFRTTGALKGGDALRLMDAVKPELVIADLALPQFHAFQIRMRMRASPDLSEIPFILLTAAKTEEIVTQAHALSIFTIFEKPVSMVELVGVARNLLERSGNGD